MLSVEQLTLAFLALPLRTRIQILGKILMSLPVDLWSDLKRRFLVRPSPDLNTLAQIRQFHHHLEQGYGIFENCTPLIEEDRSR